VTIAVAAVTLSPALTVAAASADPARTDSGASTTPRSDFTADVRSIDHGLGIVTLVGTGPAGGSVGITGDGVETTWTEAGRDGAWTTTVRVRSGERVLRVTSQVSGQAIDVPVNVLLLQPPGMLATVDGPARTISLEGTGHPQAHFVIEDDGETVGETDADADGAWSFTLRDLAFGDHHVEAWQYFDGTHNGGVDEVYTVSGAAVVSTATASRETERIALAGRAPVGTTLRFADDDGPVLDAHGRPVTAATGSDTSWSVELPIPEAARFSTVTVTTFDGATELGTTEARVTVPLALTGAVDVLADGSVRLAGTGEIGGVVSLEAEDGTPLESPDGYPIATAIGRGWELTVPRALLPDDVVIARQRVDGVAQGTLRLVLPGLPVHPTPRPEPGQGTGQGTGSGSGSVVSTGTHPTAQHAAAGPITVASAKQLAYTGTDPGVPVRVAGAFLASGLGALVVARRMRRRGAHRE
jgi:hypothetical protein